MYKIHVYCDRVQGHVCYSCLLPPDATLTPPAVSLAVSTVRNFWSAGLLGYLGVPGSVLDQIGTNQSYASEDEKRMAGLQYYLQTISGASWGRIASMLWYLGEQTALETVRQHLPHKTGEYTVFHCCITYNQCYHAVFVRALNMYTASLWKAT